MSSLAEPPQESLRSEWAKWAQSQLAAFRSESKAWLGQYWKSQLRSQTAKGGVEICSAVRYVLLRTLIAER